MGPSTRSRRPQLDQRTRWAPCRAPTTKKRDHIYAAFDYPGVVAHVGALDVKSGEVEQIARLKGPMIYAVASLAYEQAGRRPAAPRTTATTATSSAWIRRPARRRCYRRSAHRRARLRQGRTAVASASTISTACARSSDGAAVRGVDAGGDLSVRNRGLRWTSRPDGTKVVAAFGEITARWTCGSWRRGL